jgi:hypothetical protein
MGTEQPERRRRLHVRTCHLSLTGPPASPPRVRSFPRVRRAGGRLCALRCETVYGAGRPTPDSPVPAPTGHTNFDRPYRFAGRSPNGRNRGFDVALDVGSMEVVTFPRADRGVGDSD